MFLVCAFGGAGGMNDDLAAMDDSTSTEYLDQRTLAKSTHSALAAMSTEAGKYVSGRANVSRLGMNATARARKTTAAV
jgi:hypothetical protein